MTHRIVLPAALLGLAVPAATAQAATVATDLPCYVERQPMAISGTGFAPGSGFSVETEQLFGSGNADAAGNFLLNTEVAPILPTITPDTKQFTLTAKQDGTPVATTTFRVANFAARLTPDRGRPTSNGTWTFSGFTPGKPIYVHVRRSGRTLANHRFGTAAAPCGTLRKRARRLPIRRSRIRSGTYRLFFDARRTFSPNTRPQLRASTTVFTTFR